jgi:predicted RNA-binding protein with PIN domain
MQLILVDSCNLIHRIPSYRVRLAEGVDVLSRQLLDELRLLHDLEHWELHLVVDGKGERLEQVLVDGMAGLSIIFTASGQTADTVIESWLLRLDDAWTVRVATEDRTIRHTALAQGAEPLSASELMDWVGRVRQRFQRAQQRQLRDSDSDFGNRLEGLP